MRCPRCAIDLSSTYTPKGVLVDYCTKCQGIWFDRGELLYYVKEPGKVVAAIEEGLINEHPSTADCPRCSSHLKEGGLLDPGLLVDRCTGCGGLWLDASELTQLQKLESGTAGLTADRFLVAPKTALAELNGDSCGDAGTAERSPFDAPPGDLAGEPIEVATDEPRRPVRGPLPGLPNLLVRSIGTFVALYGLLGVVLIVIVTASDLPPIFAVIPTLVMIALSYAFSPFIMDFFLKWLQRLRWVQPSELPEGLRGFVAATCKTEGIKFPSFGIIDDGTPNAFTYGHVPGNARIVVTRGLIERLTPEELNAVVAHEIGHAVHWDILVMTMASTVPILLYYIARTLMEVKNDKAKGVPQMAGIVAYLLYVVAEYVVLFLSRTREYWADRYAAQATGNPNALSRALIKIAYGLASSQAVAVDKGTAKAQNRTLHAMASLGIFDPTSARGLVATSLRGRANELTADTDKALAKENIIGAMQWDLWNPWALYFELHSTHPLPAKRIEALARTSEAIGQEPYIVFNAKQPESYWDEFAVDFSISFLPLFAFLVSSAWVVNSGLREGAAIGAVLAACGVAWYLKLAFSYPTAGYLPHSIAALLKYVKVSHVRSVPSEIKGTIIGKGVPGLVYSEDLTLDDGTGYIFLDYNQPLAIFNFIFGLRNDRFIGREVKARGWYRRAPVPYFELYQLDTPEGTKTCYAPFFRKVFAGLMILGGIALLMAK